MRDRTAARSRHRRLRSAVLAWLALLIGTPLQAQTSDTGLAEAARLGGLARLAPLCRLRSEAWGLDLRRAALAEATGSLEANDQVIEMAPGSARVQRAIAEGESAALKELNQPNTEAVCARLRDNATLEAADRLVDRFRGRPRGGAPMQ